MALTRLYIEQPFEQGHSLKLEDKTHHYICHVLRRKIHDKLHLFNGKQGEFEATITSISKKDVTVYVEKLVRPQSTLTPLSLYIPPLRPSRMAFLMEKITEVGVTDIYPLITDHTVHSLGSIDKLRRYLIESAEQCERLCLPTLHASTSLKQWLQNCQTPILWAYERSTVNLNLTAESASAIKECCLLIGPEGGFSSAEIDLLKEHPFIYEISLGPQVLRAETAAIVGLFMLTLQSKL